MIPFLLAFTLSLAKTPGGATQQLPKDTLRVDGRTLVGAAVPVTVEQVPGDLNFDGRLSTADIVALVQAVFNAKPLPKGDTLAWQIEVSGKRYLFIQTKGLVR